MKYKILIAIFSIIISQEAFSKNDTAKIARNLMYLEAGGAGGYGSLNYERVIYTRKYLTLSMRAGISTYQLRDFTDKFNPDLLIPLTIQAYYGKDHKIELGAGETYSNIVHADKTSFKPERKSNFHAIFSIGYRYQKNKGGMVFRCAYTPIIEFNRHFMHWGAVSVGYAF